MHPKNFRCTFCLKERHSHSSCMWEGKRYCAPCLRFFLTNREIPIPQSFFEPRPVKFVKTKNSTKWWDAQAKTWRWVSKNGRRKAETKKAPRLTPRQQFEAALYELWPSLRMLQ